MELVHLWITIVMCLISCPDPWDNYPILLALPMDLFFLIPNKFSRTEGYFICGMRLLITIGFFLSVLANHCGGA